MFNISKKEGSLATLTKRAKYEMLFTLTNLNRRLSSLWLCSRVLRRAWKNKSLLKWKIIRCEKFSVVLVGIEKDTATTLYFVVVELYLSTALYSVEEIGTIWKLEKIFGELENFQHNIGTTRNRGMMLVLRVCH